MMLILGRETENLIARLPCIAKLSVCGLLVHILASCAHCAHLRTRDSSRVFSPGRHNPVEGRWNAKSWRRQTMSWARHDGSVQRLLCPKTICIRHTRKNNTEKIGKRTNAWFKSNFWVPTSLEIILNRQSRYWKKCAGEWMRWIKACIPSQLLWRSRLIRLIICGVFPLKRRWETMFEKISTVSLRSRRKVIMNDTMAQTMP